MASLQTKPGHVQIHGWRGQLKLRAPCALPRYVHILESGDRHVAIPLGARFDERQGGEDPFGVGEVLARRGVGWWSVFMGRTSFRSRPGRCVRARGGPRSVDQISPYSAPVDWQESSENQAIPTALRVGKWLSSSTRCARSVRLSATS
jgi:hypothetical protein